MSVSFEQFEMFRWVSGRELFGGLGYWSRCPCFCFFGYDLPFLRIRPSIASTPTILPNPASVTP